MSYIEYFNEVTKNVSMNHKDKDIFAKVANEVDK